MAERGWAKGPWKWHRVDEEGCVPEYALHGPSAVLCRYWFGDPTPEAHLIAAAPDLYEALQQIANGEGAYGAQALEYKNIARAALAKAEAKE